MYRSTPTNRDRAATIAFVVAVHGALLFALLNLSGPLPDLVRSEALQVIDLLRPPPPPPPPPIIERAKPKPKQAAAPAAPKNIESKATPVVRPIPKVVIPVPSPIVTAPKPGTGAAATQGASTPGAGTGAGGAGTGTGGSGAGSGGGGGGGGGGGVAVRPSLVRGITNRDYPEVIQRGWPRGGQVFVRVRVEANGRPSQCDVMRSFGDAAIDQWTCSLVMSRASFRPATDAAGRPVSAWFGYVQSDQGRFER